MSDAIACSFCLRGDDLVHGRGTAVICASCVEKAYAQLHPIKHASPYSNLYGSMLTAIAIAEGRAKAVRPGLIRLVTDERRA
jgi:2-hydroxychromene-2-carboxylate isomerase